ncbi:hypothetical protein MSIMFI_05615 [Mycobacterium simulans]|nr:hypothetical protein MSIMFI_05615 [Mycobacterium simulans]
MAGQLVRKPVTGAVKLLVAPRLARTHQRHRLRAACDLRTKHFRNRHRFWWGGAQRGTVADRIQAGVFGGIEQIDRAQPPPRIGHHCLQHLLEPRDERVDAGRVEHIGGELDAKRQLGSGNRDHGQRVMGVFAAGDRGEGQLVVTKGHRSVDGVIFVDKKGVKQPGMTGDSVDVA